MKKLQRWFASCSLLGAAAACGGVHGLPAEPLSRSKGAGERVLIVVTSNDRLGDSPEKTGFWLSELTHFHRAITAAGFAADIISPRGGAAPIEPDSLDLDDPINQTFMADPVTRGQIENTGTPDGVDPDRYVAIFFAGGHGAMGDLTDNAALAAITAKMYESGNIVSAVCHGPSALLNVKLSSGRYLIEGKQITAFSGLEELMAGRKDAVPYLFEDEIERRGAEHRTAFLPFVSNVWVSDRIVTGQNVQSSGDVAAAVLRLLGR